MMIICHVLIPHWLAAELQDYSTSSLSVCRGELHEELTQKVGWLCRQEPDGLRLLKVNFDPGLVRALREVHYFLLMSELPQQVPPAALKVGRHCPTCSSAGPAELMMALQTCTQLPVAAVL